MGRQVRDYNLQYLQSRKLKRKYLLIVLSLVLFVSGLCLAVYLSKLRVYFPSIAIIALLGLLVGVLAFKSKIMYYTQMETYFKLLSVSEPKYIIKEKFQTKWINELKQIGFIDYFQGDNYDTFYRLSKINDRKVSHTNQVLEIITLFKNENIKLYSDQLDTLYKKIYIESKTKKNISKQVILQFKKYDKSSKKVIDELDQIIAFKDKKSFLITINCGYFPKENNSFYYLHSNKFYPNEYYKYGSDLIKQIVK